MEFSPSVEIERLGGRLVSLGDELMFLSSHIETFDACANRLAAAEEIRAVSRSVRTAARKLVEQKEKVA